MMKPTISDALEKRARNKAELIKLRAADGYPIAALRYEPSGPARANLIVAGAIGVPQGFYRRFAQFAASRGFSVMTLDYRGIGLSAPATLRGFQANCIDWGRLDLAAAVDAMTNPCVPLYMAGHSYGGHAFGMLPNHEKIAALFTFGTGAGWHGWMAPVERIKVLALWHIVAPVIAAWKGYLPLGLVGMGEGLPLDAYRQWKRWCQYPNFLLGDPSMRHMVDGFARVRTRMLAVNSVDDLWSPPRSRDAFMAGYTNAALQTLDIRPAEVGARAIGHMGYFRNFAASLWEASLEWLDVNPNTSFWKP